jgi:hypothetical protein
MLAGSVAGCVTPPERVTRMSFAIRSPSKLGLMSA